MIGRTFQALALAATMLVTSTLPTQAWTYLNDLATVTTLQMVCNNMLDLDSTTGAKSFASCVVNSEIKRMDIVLVMPEAAEGLDPLTFAMAAKLAFKQTRDKACSIFFKRSEGVVPEDGWKVVYSYADGTPIGACDHL